MSNRLVERADRICVIIHFLAWCAAATTWGLNWLREGAAPSGPVYYSAQTFISRVDVLAYGVVYESTIKIAELTSAWFLWDSGATLTITFGCLILLAGTLQWFLLGRLVQWVSARKSRVAALALLGSYGVWAFGALLSWVAT